MLKEWILKECGVDLSDVAADGVGLADAFAHALDAAGFSIDEQLPLILEATLQGGGTDFVEACLDRIERIETLQRRRAEALARFNAHCQNGGGRQRTAAPAADVAIHRFMALWPVTDEHADVVDDMLRRLADEGFLLLDDGALRDLRQGLGYYRRGEDTLRLRRPVRWLDGKNTLHYWVCQLTRRVDPLCGCTGAVDRKWLIAASLFADRDGHAYRKEQIQHGEVSSPARRRWLDDVVPMRPAIR